MKMYGNPFVFNDSLDDEWDDLKNDILSYYNDAFKIFGIDTEIQNEHPQNKNELYAYWADETERFNVRSEMLEKNDHVHIYHYLTCVGEPVFEDERVRQLSFQNKKGEIVQIESKCFVFAMGAVENTRMLLIFRESLAEKRKQNLQNIGRFVMDHPRVWHGEVERLTEKSTLSDHQIKRTKFGYYKTGIRNDPNTSRVYCNLMRRGKRLDKLLDFIPSESFQVSFQKFLMKEKGALKAMVNEILKWPLLSHTERFRNSLNLFFDKDLDDSFYVMSYCEQKPREENQIILTGETDRNGLPVPELQNHIHQEELDEVKHFYKNLKSFFRDMDCTFNYNSEYLSVPKNYVDASHIMGGTRYSSNKEKSVLQKDLSVMGIPNLYITGSSVFPTSSVENPTHLIVSLSCYLADVLSKKFCE